MKILSTDKNNATVALDSRKRDVAVVWGHVVQLTSASAFQEGIRSYLKQVTGGESVPAWRSAFTDALDAMVTAHARTIRAAIMLGWRTNSLSRAAVITPGTKTVDGLRYTVDHPSASSPIYFVPQTLSPTTYPLSAISTPDAARNAPCYGALTGTAIQTVFTSLLSVKIQLLAIANATGASTEKSKADLEDRYASLLASATPFMLFRPIDFVSVEGNRIILPRNAFSFDAAAVGSTTVVPSSTNAYERVRTLEQVAATVNELMRTMLEYSVEESGEVIAKSEAGVQLSDDNAWLSLPAYGDQTVTLTPGETALLVSNPEALLAVVPSVIKDTDGGMAFTSKGYAATIYRLSQSLSVLRGSITYKNDWSTTLEHSPANIFEYRALLASQEDRAYSNEVGTAAHFAYDIISGKVQADLAMGSAMPAPLQHAIKYAFNDPLPLTSDVQALMRAALPPPKQPTFSATRSGNSWTLSYDGKSYTMTVQWQRKKGVVTAYEEGKTSTTEAWVALTAVTRAQGWDIALQSLRIANLICSAMDASRSELVDGDKLQLLVPARAALVRQLPAITSARDVMYSPYIYNSDAK